jgi:hypothetical protein
MPVGLFRSEGAWVQVNYGTRTTIPVPRPKYEANGYKPDFRQTSLGSRVRRRKKRRKMMPRGPKGEKRPADVIRAPASWSAGIISPSPSSLRAGY